MEVDPTWNSAFIKGCSKCRLHRVQHFNFKVQTSHSQRRFHLFRVPAASSSPNPLTSGNRGIDRVKCKYCKKDLAAATANGTTGLRQHLGRCIPYKTLIKPPTQKKIHFPSKDKHELEEHWEFDQQLIRRALVEMIIVDELPFSFVEKEGFKKDWKLHKRILNFCPVTSHKGEHMAESISNCLLHWNLDKVFTITIDNASSNDVTVRELSKQLNMWRTNIMDGKHLHVRCMTHILNLIVQEGLKEIDASVKCVRQMVRYVRGSSARTRSFKKCCEVQKVGCAKTLLLDVPTRWNSTYAMLNTAQNFEKAFNRFDFFDENFKTYLATHVCEDGSVVGTLECDD
ncbi:uncharacterized protein LOC132053721 [Lycium ferocissimum]|uniref:uncharacterized protein LOC132053721 n=1 Tax=Lycium ferocissimum TaxID=112874 RepID=UPI002815D4C3|nr:uncharacterized protein LOC132053721 [Lycium ferocissimum]